MIRITSLLMGLLFSILAVAGGRCPQIGERAWYRNPFYCNTGPSPVTWVP